MKILLANPRGFCAGVNRAIDIVNRVLSLYQHIPIYVYHEIIHNRYVVDSFSRRGVIFVEDLSKIPKNSILIFSAHGVSLKIRKKAQLKGLFAIFDATCPLVSQVHFEVFRSSRIGREVILIGNSGHPEVEATLGQYKNFKKGGIYLVKSCEDVWKLKIKNKNNLCFITQTTLNFDDVKHVVMALKFRFPNIIFPKRDSICYATKNRQEAIKDLIQQSDMVLVIGSKNSSNSNQLFEIGRKENKKIYLIDSFRDIQKDWIANIFTIGIISSASSPEILVLQIIKFLKKFGVNEVVELKGIKENMVFKVPVSLI